MSLDRTYGFVYAGVTGIGIGAMSINNGELIGADYSGGRYQGRITEDPLTSEIPMDVVLTLSPGVSLVDETA